MANEYTKYLKSEHWQNTRARALDRANDECQICQSQVDLQVHHNTYENMGNEKDGDLIVACEVCHIKHHDKVNLLKSFTSKS